MASTKTVTTDDGSHSLFNTDRDLHYRSHYGAVTESKHVFVDLMPDDQPMWRVAELGFGAGINFEQTWIAAQEHGVKLKYLAFERDPVDVTSLPISDDVKILIENGDDVLKIVTEDWRTQGSYRWDADVFYHDPFGPSDDPESWTETCFRWTKQLLKPDGVLTTYAAASAVKRALVAAGYSIASRPGPGHKREVTVASETVESLASYNILDLSKYQ